MYFSTNIILLYLLKLIHQQDLVRPYASLLLVHKLVDKSKKITEFKQLSSLRCAHVLFCIMKCHECSNGTHQNSHYKPTDQKTVLMTS